MRVWRKPVLSFLLISAAALSLCAQKRTYQSFNSNVPFSFSIGDRKFHAGYYEFIVVGAGLMTMRDERGHVLATLITRQLQDQERDVPPRFVFAKKNGHARLASVWMEKGAQGYQILGEEVAMRQSQPPSVPVVLFPPVSQTPTLLKR